MVLETMQVSRLLSDLEKATSSCELQFSAP